MIEHPHIEDVTGMFMPNPAEEPAGTYVPMGEPIPTFNGPAPSRSNLTVAAWLRRELPPRDYLLGEVLCTTSRWIINGATGVGKTLFALEMAGAIAAGADFLGWQGRRRARVMYLDGELPAETFKERIELIAARYGEDIELFGYNRDDLDPSDMPPLNTEEGQKWLWREVEGIAPDAIFFDSIMCLNTGVMAEEESWSPVKPLMRALTSRRITQVWLHHTGHDTSKGFGTKTREWEMDTVAMLTKTGDDGDADASSSAFELAFSKARLRTPANFGQFTTKTIRREADGFTFENRSVSKKSRSEVDIVKQHFVAAYDRLADDVKMSADLTGKPVRKVAVDAIRDELKSRGYLEANDKGHVTPTGRTTLRRAKLDLLAKQFVEADGLIWRITPK